MKTVGSIARMDTAVRNLFVSRGFCKYNYEMNVILKLFPHHTFTALSMVMRSVVEMACLDMCT
jgi:hypothetical protein